MMESEQLPLRQAWIGVLAKAPLELLEQRVAALEGLPDYQFLRSPEIGLAMVRGRAEGTGEPFNLGEMTLTRCVVQLVVEPELAIAGFGYVAGRSQHHAELAALCDALLQHPHWSSVIQSQIIAPLQAAAEENRAATAAETASTQVNFFTLLRGES
ncbi:phosphonate C-P lyase system protein PhnG [filamentous cyanobacterium CCP5]|nr:phosphonate C-P lyase system protein PhnG [filamentous cyanobacterium CCP5]